jgi:hypothetical protein
VTFEDLVRSNVREDRGPIGGWPHRDRADPREPQQPRLPAASTSLPARRGRRGGRELWPGERLTLHVQGLDEPVETDIAGGNKLFFRSRSFWGEFMSTGLPEGDSVVIRAAVRRRVPARA